MSQPAPALESRGAFADVSLCNVMHGEFNVSAREDLALCSLLARKGKTLMLAARMRECFGIELPRGARRSVQADLALAGVAPDAWWASRERADSAFVASLRLRVGDLASVVDQSDGYAVLRLSGVQAATVLGTLVPIDLHARVFDVGQVASTVIAHIGVTLWRLEDDAHGRAVFDVLMFRSLARSFWHVLRQGAEQMRG